MAGFSARRCAHMLLGRLRLCLKDARIYVAAAYTAAIAIFAVVMMQWQAQQYNQVYNIFEPFVHFLSMPWLIMFPVGGALIALCDAAQLPRESMNMLLRCRKSEWWVAEVLFTAIIIAGLYAMLLLLTVLLAIPGAYAKDVWSMYASSPAYGNADLPVVTLQYSSPSVAALFALLFQLLHALSIVQLVMTANMLSTHNRGIAIGVAVELVCYCMELFKIDWFRYISVYGRSMLTWNGMNAARTWQTVAFYALLLALELAVQRLALRRHSFICLRTE